MTYITVPIKKNLIWEQKRCLILNFNAGQFKPEAADWISDGNKDVLCPLDYLRPDALLDSFWYSHRAGLSKDQSVTGDDGALLGDDLSCEYKQASALPSDESNQSFGLGSSTWDISAVYPFSKNDWLCLDASHFTWISCVHIWTWLTLCSLEKQKKNVWWLFGLYF